jgi:GAF domain-containing protein
LTEVRSINQELRSLQTSLEQRVSDATRDLALAAEISNRITQLHDVNSMLEQATDLIRDRFDLYYTQIFLSDQKGYTLVLRAGTGEAGRTLLNRGHRLPIDMSSLNGIAAIERKSIIVEDTQTNPMHRHNPLLPETRSEMVVPILVGERVVGVLDMQSSEPGALSEENLLAFETLAGQLAVSVTNAELFAEIEQAQTALRAQAQRQSQEGWQDFMDGIERSERLAYTFDRQSITPINSVSPDSTTDNMLVAPIKVGDVQIGKLQFQREDAWTDEDVNTSKIIAQQVAQQLDNLRLLAQAEQYRTEAQETLRSLTRDGWDGFQDQFENESCFAYIDNQVKPIDGNGFSDGIKYPIKVREEPIGELTIAGVQALSKDDAELALYVNKQLSNHLENIRLSTQTQKALSETEALLDITSVASQSLNLQVTLKDVLKKILNQTYATAGLFSIFNETDKTLEIVSYDLPEPLFRKLQADGLEGTLCDLAYRSQRALILKDLREDSPIDVSGLINLGFRAYQGIPLRSKGNVLGTLCVFYDRTISEKQADSELMEVVGQQIGITIENANLFEQTQQRAEELDILNEMGRTLTSLQNEQAIYETIFKFTGKLMDTTSFFIAIYDKENHEINMPILIDSGERLEAGNQPAGNGLTNYIIKSRKPLLISDDFNSKVKDLGIDTITIGDDSPVVSWLGVPLVFKDRVIGTVTVQSNMTPGLYKERDLDLLTAISSQASIALENASAFRQTQQQAEQEATINQISQRIQSTTSVESALQVAVRELGRALGAKRTNVQLGISTPRPIPGTEILKISKEE